MMDKQQLRKMLREKLSIITGAQRKAAAITAAQLFTKNSLFKSAKNIACYYSQPLEFSTDAIITEIWQAKKNCYLPVMSEKEKTLLFALYQSEEKLCLGAYKILEPHFSAIQCLTQNLDVVLVPLLSFDKEGNRLGSGGGFYDRTFAFRKDNIQKKPLLIGLGFQQQEVPLLPMDNWDIKLDGMLTEEKLTFY